jgi:hypothetical protein
MTPHFKLNRFSLSILFALFLITACNNKGDEKKTGEGPATDTSKTVSQINPASASLTSGPLDTLWTDSLSFAQLPEKKIVFVFTFRQNDTLTLHGWSAEKDSIFTTDPDIRLIKGHSGSLKYENGMYFGNVVLKKGHVKAIQKALNKEKAQFVLFAPELVNGNHIGYDIYLSKEDPAGLVHVLGVIATGLQANPSPPKTY